MIIHTDHNGVAVNARYSLADGTDVKGYQYEVLINAFGTKLGDINFQMGTVPKNGVNGITNEALLAILIHRLKHLNTKFSCGENKSTINHLEDALANLEARTMRRINRGVEGREVA